MARTLSLAVVMVLAGCGWSGPVLYTPDPRGASPFAPGTYRIQTLDDGRVNVIRNMRLPDGQNRILDGGEGAQQVTITFAL